MIETNVIKQNDKPVAVIIDYKEYVRLRQIEEDFLDYSSAMQVKEQNQVWIKHSDLKKEMGF
ncbi:MAG: type II toxin-antitoxin system Phd/YefM family antitoxin [Candidatus Marinimicrobia bacterium]|jgi:hypothetical protein|nr:type II toxin-antitoxin system Phd/YefM family antitoxin [Candidatus Neomarinimicrobiota bacterium]MCK9485044.1 type II toxin-antitoxin system Phd/YefM family antitoxin [Candidatus Neomarinimicrobiota bacterium]MCK9560537.1 type II toxin-antitoxin system Phd/YefM family antitoxin [Candidatus Neomarinimicrobiota bacterium]MDD5539378.1 hypothetical protein [Candidatus Neomarinimicrobiota bacterium]